MPDARDILAELTTKNARLSMGGSIHDPSDPVGRLLFNVLAMVAEFEADLIRSRTREGMRVPKAKGHLRGEQPKLAENQAKHLVELSDLGTYSTAELAELFGVGRSTVDRTLLRVRPFRPTRTGRSPQIHTEPPGRGRQFDRVPCNHRPRCRPSYGTHVSCPLPLLGRVRARSLIRELCGAG